MIHIYSQCFGAVEMDSISSQKCPGKASHQEAPTLSISIPSKRNSSNELVKPSTLLHQHHHLFPSAHPTLEFFHLRLVEAVLEEGNTKGQIGSDVLLKC